MPPRKYSRFRLILIFSLIAVVAFVGIGMHLRSAWALRRQTSDDAVTIVAVTKAKKGAPLEELVLPGNVQAWHEATIYARTNGYVKQWYKGMGTPVRQGEIIAVIETPELDAQLRQTEADLKTAEANAALARSTAKRWKALLKTDSVSKQEAEEKISDAAAKQAALASARASRDHLKQLASFKNVVAPFDGTITSRTLDIGLLVTDGALGSQQALFHVAQTDRLRVYIQVPQNNAGAIKPNMTAELHFAEHPGKTYSAKLLKTADAIDPASRTLLTEFLVDNRSGELLAGGYTEAHLKLPTLAATVRLPVNTLIFRADGMQVATVDENNRALLKPITLGRDFGNEVEVKTGVAADEAVIVNPPDALTTGQPVRVLTPQEKKPEIEPAQKEKKS